MVTSDICFSFVVPLYNEADVLPLLFEQFPFYVYR